MRTPFAHIYRRSCYVTRYTMKLIMDKLSFIKSVLVQTNEEKKIQEVDEDYEEPMELDTD